MYIGSLIFVLLQYDPVALFILFCYNVILLHYICISKVMVVLSLLMKLQFIKKKGGVQPYCIKALIVLLCVLLCVCVCVCLCCLHTGAMCVCDAVCVCVSVLPIYRVCVCAALCACVSMLLIYTGYVRIALCVCVCAAHIQGLSFRLCL